MFVQWNLTVEEATAQRATTPTRTIVATLLVAHAILLTWHALATSPVESEIPHLPAGLAHWQGYGFAVYRQNPPLIRMIAAVPSMMCGARTEWTHLPRQPNERTEALVGQDFVRANPQRFLLFYRLGRLVCVPIHLLGLYVVIRWSTELYGLAGGAISGILYAFSPNLVGHGALIMPDATAAAVGVTSAYCFWRILQRPSLATSCIGGTALGAALLTKTTLLLLIPVWLSFVIVFSFRPMSQRALPTRHLWGLTALMLLVAVYVLNLGYFFEGSFFRTTDIRVRSRTLQQITNGAGFASLREVPLPFPTDFVLGIDTQLSDFEQRSIRSYMRGQWNDRGWPVFYLYVLVVKLPLGTITLFVLALLVSLVDWSKARGWAMVFLLAHGLTILAVVSAHTGFTLHGRYVWPMLPYVFICCGRLGVGLPKKLTLVCLGLSVAAALSMLAQCPHSLGYFNEITGGSRHGSFHLLDSNLAWGQDLLHLKRWSENHPDARPLYLLSPFGVDAKLAGVPAIPCLSPTSGGEIPSGWYVVDVHYLRGSRLSLHQQCPHEWERRLKEFANSLVHRDPHDRVGVSLHVYRVTNDEENQPGPLRDK